MMDKGYRVKCMAVGTEDQDLGGLLARLSAMIEDVAVIESGPMVEKKQAYIIVRHAKFGFKKGKKASKGTTSPTDNLKAGPSQGHVRDEELDDTVSHSESEDDIDSDEMETPSTSNELPHGDLGENKTTWSLSDVNTDLETIFSFDDNKGVASSSVTRQTGGERGGVFPLEAVPNASLPYSKPGLPPVTQGPMQMDDNRYRGPTQMSENRYGGRTEVRSRFQSSDGAVPQKDVASASTPYSKLDPRSTNLKVPFLAQGPTQMDDSRYRGPTQTAENRYGGAAQMGENRYGGPTRRQFQPTELTNSTSPQKDVANASSKQDVGRRPIGGNRYGEPSEVRSCFQPTMSRETPAGNIKPSEFSPVYSSQFNRGPGASNRVQQGPESPYEGGQSRSNVSGYPPTEHMPVRNDASSFRNSTQPSTDKVFKKEQSIQNAPGSQRPSYGIFSAPKHAAATRQSAATEVVGDGGNSTLKSSKTQ
ncbi:hypothetical protein FRX31_005289 [Thalictrum thalictroides]|uniref:Uncharacterized protein n=1 Tax=Thalictrum thalictroides TaxID=46969 RepID=A0A7J6X7X6_THATH|nr:hypothetical protein FRX31_005289 [Thalictrum thalictroides]